MTTALSLRRLLAGTGLTLVAALVPVSGSPAAEPTPSPAAAQTWGVVPSSATGPTGRAAFDYKLDPGATLTDHVGVVNPSTEPITLAMYAHDAVTTADGGFDLRTTDTQPTDVGSWITFDSDTVTVPARSRVDIPFALAVPANATPGDHVGGIVTSLADTAVQDGVTVERRVGARLYLRVSGELDARLTVEELIVTYHGSVNPFAGGTTTATFTVRNTGNARLAATPVLNLNGPFGIPAGYTEGPAFAQILPGQTVAVTLQQQGTVPLLRLTATASVTATSVDGGVAPPTASEPAAAAFWAVPWPQLALITALAAGVWWTVRLRRAGQQRQRRQLAEARAAGRAEAQDAPSPENDTDATSHRPGGRP